MGDRKKSKKGDRSQLDYATFNREDIARRKRIQFYKNVIVVLLCIISILPITFSMFLLYQITTLEDQVSYLAGQKEANVHDSMEQIEESSSDEVDAVGEKEEADDEKKEATRVYLTFDDGPSENTNEILDILKKNKVKATFFVIGKTDANSMDAYRRIVKEGHGIGIHSYTHEYNQIYSSLDAFQKDVTSMSDLIYAATGVRTHMYRFPGGSANTVCSTSMTKLIEWLNEEGYVYYDWNALNGDAVTKGLSVSTLVHNVMDGVKKNGDNTSVVLMHDLGARHNTVESLEPLIKELKQGGYVLDEPLTEDVKPVQQKKLEK